MATGRPPRRSATERLRRLDTPTIANAIARLGARPPTVGYSSLELRSLIGHARPVVGYAVTCREDTTTPRDTAVGTEAIYRAIEASDKPAVVVCQDVGLDRLRSCHLGDVMAATMQACGAVGFVTDGGVRDLAGIRTNAAGFHVFGAGAVAAAGSPSLIDVGGVVSICGLTIGPGDLLHGDENGLLTIPREIVDEVLSVAEEIQRDERARLERIHRPGFRVDDLFPRP